MTEGPVRSTVPFALLSACMAMGYGVIFTIVGDFREAYGVTDAEVGLIIGVGFFAAVFSQVFIAPMADRGSARKIMLAGIALNVVGLLLMAAATSATVLLIGRIVSGLGIGAALPAVRRIVIVSDPDNLGQNLGRLMAADVFGFAIGPAVSAITVSWLDLGLWSPFIVVAGLSVLTAIPVFGADAGESTDAPKQRLALDLLRNRSVLGAMLLGSAAYLMIGTFDALWDVVHEDLDTPDLMANLGITLFAIPLIVLGPFAGRLAQQFGPFWFAAAGLGVASVFMAIYGFLPTGLWIFAFAMGHAITDGFTFSASGIAISMAVPEDRQSGAHGLMGATQALTAGIAASAIGAIYGTFGRAPAYVTCAIGMVVLVVTGMFLARDAWSGGAARRRARAAGVDDLLGVSGG